MTDSSVRSTMFTVQIKHKQALALCFIAGFLVGRAIRNVR